MANKKVIAVVAVAVVILLLIGMSDSYFEYRKSLAMQNSTETNKKEVAGLVAKVGALIELPKGEEPTAATVSDPSKLAGQVFFANAQLGDKVLIYMQAKKAILYRPGTNKIIEVGPVNINPAPVSAP